MAESNLEDVKLRLAILEVRLVLFFFLRNTYLWETYRGQRCGRQSCEGFTGLRKKNGRLKEVLIKYAHRFFLLILTLCKLSRLQDMTRDFGQEQRRRIPDMEWDVSAIGDLQASCDETVIKLTNAKIQIEVLKLQFDDALAAEHMLERLTECNLVLGEVRHLVI